MGASGVPRARDGATPGRYGLLLRQNYENYFRECEEVLKNVAAMAKRAINNEQAELVRAKLAELKYNVFSPEEVDGTMNWVIKKMAKVSPDASKYEKMKADYRVFYAKLNALNFDDTKADFAQFLMINESAFEAHLGGLIAAGKPFEGVVDLSFGELRSGMPNRNPIYLQFLEMNVELIRDGGKGMQGDLAARIYMMEKWAGAIKTELAAGQAEVLPGAAKALVYESLKLMSMGRMTGVGRELNLTDIYAMTKRLMSEFVTGDAVAKLGHGEAASTAKMLDDYAAALEKYPVHDQYQDVGIPGVMRALASSFRNPRVVR